ncbi:hypothetical protein F183_A28950 [Bryobacterales bacterium F-183]|nr:hypothetical protein F183_A28950 [Bryobacterales bacterium F-183]
MHQTVTPAVPGIAIIGLAGRFPGAATAREFWANVAAGVESIRTFETSDLGDIDLEQASEPNYVRARGVLDNVAGFDPAFFGILPGEAARIDPQHRVFLENCWECLEDAGYDIRRVDVPVGIYAGCSYPSYLLNHVLRNGVGMREYLATYQVGGYSTMLGSMTDSLATRVAYKLNLRGPACTLLTACSTSLVAVAQACSSLATHQCDMALAGGVSITFPQERGYLYQEGGMVSPDGHCRTFDAKAQGTVFGSGSGVVLLKRLDDARFDRDHIYAVIQGWAINNDGSAKAGFTAPSVHGQSEVIAAAHALAGVTARQISYVEAHGTGTPLGDPIEIAALQRVFGETTDDRGFCALGTAKPNVGHLDVASGVAGLIKTALSLERKVIPPLLHFETANSDLNLENSAFSISATPRPWEPGVDGVRYAGVSAFGVGGTNAHVVVREAPEQTQATQENGQARSHLLVLSARTEAALGAQASNLADHLKSNPDANLTDVAYTLAVGRGVFPCRRFVVGSNRTILQQALQAPAVAHNRSATKSAPGGLHFLFSGQGSQYPGMMSSLYESEAVVRRFVDQGDEILRPRLGRSLRDLMFETEDTGDLDQTIYAQPAIFLTQVALSQLWKSWGVKPMGFAGHSIGEFAAACLAEVFTFEDALNFVAARGALMQELPRGAMLSVRLPVFDLLPYLANLRLSIAAINAPNLTVVAGPVDEIEDLALLLKNGKIACRALKTSHAFHSPMMDPVVSKLTELAAAIRLRPPNKTLYSSVTGKLLEADQAINPAYWGTHCRETVRFSAILAQLRAESGPLLDIGPGRTGATLARQHPGSSEQIIVSALPGVARNGLDEYEAVLHAAGSLWCSGLDLDWPGFFRNRAGQRTPLPTYPFERVRCWIDHPESQSAQGPEIPPMTQRSAVHQASTESATGSRFIAELTSCLADLSGLKPAEIAADAEFLELGFDSLFLTQASQAIAERFHVPVTFRQLMEELSTVALLSKHLDSLLPKGITPNVPHVEAPIRNDDGSTVESLAREQLRVMSDLMARQLEAMRGVAPAAVPTSATSEVHQQGPFKPPQSNKVAVSPEQADYLKSFAIRYSKKTRGSKALAQEYRQVLADPRLVSGFHPLWKEITYPIAVERSAGSRLWDVDGNEYVDLLNGFGPIAFGHRPDFIQSAITQQLQRGMEIGPMTPLAGKVAKLLCDMVSMDRATFCNTGSEAVMAAVRLARTVTGRKKVVLFSGSYHGNFDEVLLKASGSGDQSKSRPAAPGIPAESIANMVALKYGAPESLETIRRLGHELAAILVEPVQSRHPDLQPKAFLHELRGIADTCGCALIFDEVVTGFRIHPGGAQAHFGVRADIATYGKVLGGGMPIGAIAGSARFMDALDGGAWRFGDDSRPECGVTFFAGTFVRHPLALAAAAAVLEHLKACGPALQEGLTKTTAALVARLNRILEANGVPTHIESFGSLFYFPVPTSLPFGGLIFHHLRYHGFHLQEGFPCFLTTAHQSSDLDRFVDAFESSLQDMRAGGLLPSTVSQPEQPPKSVPITESQLEILLSARISDEANCAFNESVTVTLNGPLDQGVLRSALQQVLDRHRTLHSRFDFQTNQVHFAVPPPVDLAVVEATEEGLSQFVQADAAAPFDLVNGPLFRLQLLRVGEASHRLIFSAHHIVCDGWSLNLLLEELAEIYSAYIQKRSARLLPVVTYRPGHVSADAEAYWSREFATLPTVLQLPTDRPHGALKSSKGATVCRAIPDELVARMQRTGSHSGATLHNFMLAGFDALLFRLTGQNDLVVGVPFAGQAQFSGQAVCGHAVNFLPIRALQEESTTFDQLLRQCRTRLLNASEHQALSYGTLLRKLEVPRDPSRLPLVEVQFNIERLGQALSFAGLESVVHSNPKAFVNFDLFVNVVQSSTGWRIECDYNTSLLDQGTVQRWLQHYETLLAAAAAAPLTPIARLPLLTEEERGVLAHRGTRTPAEYPQHRLVHQLFEQQASRTPNAPAVRFGEAHWTYAELDQRVNRIAQHLADLGIGPGARVGLCVDRSRQMLAAILGVLKAGACYVPLDASLPPQRLQHILSIADVSALLTEKAMSRIGALGSVRKVLLDDIAGVDVPAGTGTPEQNDVQSPAYIIFTSGSTGVPKGVQIPHRAAVNFLTSMVREPGITAKDRLLAITTPSFDISVLELFLPLVVGAEVVIASREETLDGGLLASRIERDGITILQATPATWRLLLEAGWQAPQHLRLLCGGEAMSRAMANSLTAHGAELWNMYGPTETTVWASVARVTYGDQPISIGEPIDNTHFHVMDKEGELCPLGVVGELCIGGDGLAIGYFGDPATTAKKFVTSTLGGGRVYRTGDLARRLPNGDIDLIGRLDHQVKIRGFRIELGEIEATLGAHQGIAEAVVLAKEVSTGDRQLFACYLSAGASTHCSSSELREWLAQKLPSYMIPASFLELAEFPRTPNGKVDRTALASLVGVGKPKEKVFRAPLSESEKHLASCCEKVLGVSQIHVDVSLFDYGMDSLRMFQIVTRASNGGFPVTAADMLRYQNISAICAHVDRDSNTSLSPTTQPRLRKVDRMSRLFVDGQKEAAQ